MSKRDALNVRYSHMKERCYNKNSKSYKRYGGRGIKVCDEWKNSYQSFKDWALKNGYQDGLEIDRIDNEGDYSPDNCRFVTKKENLRNTSRCKYYTYNGKTQNLSKWCEELGLNYQMVAVRIHRGIDFETAIKTPKREWNPSELVGKRFSHLVVIGSCEERTYDGRIQYFCRCDCGNIAKVAAKHLRNGKTKSCGCLSEKYFGEYASKNKFSMKG